MLTKPYRLSRQSDFGKLKKNGRSFFSPSLRFRYLANYLPQSRFSVVVSTKISKKAVVRNRLRRQLLEIIRLNLAKIKPGYDFLIFTSQKALDLDYGQMEQEVLFSLKRSSLLNKA